MRIAVLAVQGAFTEHERILRQLGADCVELRKAEDLTGGLDGIVLPGGESTVQRKLLRELNLLEGLRERTEQGIPVLATCAGLILLAEKIAGGDDVCFGTLPISVRRNAYGRQLGSFSDFGKISGIQEASRDFPLEFIRAPYIESIRQEVQPIVVIEKMPDGSQGENIVGVRYKNQIGLAFHPELTDDTRLHEMFLEMCRLWNEKRNKTA